MAILPPFPQSTPPCSPTSSAQPTCHHKPLIAMAVAIVILMGVIIIQMAVYTHRMQAPAPSTPNTQVAAKTDQTETEKPKTNKLGGQTKPEPKEPVKEVVEPKTPPAPVKPTSTADLEIVAKPAPSPKTGPLAKITGPGNAEKESYCAAGDLVRFSAKGSVGSAMVWKVVPPDGEEHTIPALNGDLAFAYSKVGDYTILLIVSQDSRVDVASHVLHNGQDKPNPGPAPNPNPGPKPDPNNPFADLRRITTESALAKIPTSPSRPAILQKLGKNMNDMANLILAGTFKTNKEVREETRRRNFESLGDDVDAVQPWSVWLGEQVKAYDSKGLLAKPEDYAPCWKAIGDGLLDAAKK